MTDFKIGETGYGFDQDGEFYSYVMNEDTDSMGNLFKTREEAIEDRIHQTKEELNELYQMIDWGKCEHVICRITADKDWDFCVKCGYARHIR